MKNVNPLDILQNPDLILGIKLVRSDIEELDQKTLNKILDKVATKKKHTTSKAAILIRSVLNQKIEKQRKAILKESSDNLNTKLPKANLIPAALFYSNHGGCGVYIKWKGGDKKYGNRVLSASSSHIHMLLPDREILIVGNLNTSNANFSFGEWDEFVALSLFHDSSNNSVTTSEGFMVNAFQNKSLGRNAETRPSTNPNAKIITSDSGGYQLLNIEGIFISPVEVGKFYNKNVDQGMVLDFPLWDATHQQNLMDSAYIQKTNTEILQQTIDPHVKLINICHGGRCQQLLEYMDIVHVPNLRSIAIGRNGSLFNFVYNTISFVQALHKKYPNHYTHLHLLGVSDHKTTLCFLRALHYGLLGDIELTMDSSTANQTATIKTFFSTPHIYLPPRYLKLGNDSNLLNSEMRLPCSCPVCHAIGWVDAINVLSSNQIAITPLLCHNIFAMESYFRVLYNMARYNSLDELKSYTCKVIGNKYILDEVDATLGFVEDLRGGHIDQVVKKYRYFLKDENTSTSSLIPLVGSLEEKDEDFDILQPDEDWLEDDREYWEIDRERLDNFRASLDIIAHNTKTKDQLFGVKIKTKSKSKSKKSKGKSGKRKTVQTKIKINATKTIQQNTTKKPSLAKHKARSNAIKKKVGTINGKTKVRTRKTRRL